jgi:protein-S-isoprenylcysteine O-methyltransferase Ste14
MNFFSNVPLLNALWLVSILAYLPMYLLYLNRHTKNIVIKQQPLRWAGFQYCGIGLGLFVLPMLNLMSVEFSFASYSLPSSLKLVGVILYPVAFLLLWISHVELGANWSPGLALRYRHKLVTSGVYQHVRHPMYMAFWLGAIAQAMLIANWLVGGVGLAAWGIFYAALVRAEERMMVEHFGDDYRRYIRRTGRLRPRMSRYELYQKFCQHHSRRVWNDDCQGSSRCSSGNLIDSPLGKGNRTR